MSEHDINNEPHLNNENFKADPSEQSAKTGNDFQHLSTSEKLDQSVNQEPAFSSELSGMGQEFFPTFKKYYERQNNRFSVLDSWAVTFAAAMLAGPLAIVTAIWGTNVSWVNLITMVVFAPVTEEIAKVLVCLIIVEKWPWIFKSGIQIVLCCFAGGLAFGVIENLIYSIRLADHPNYYTIMQFRWVATTTLHIVCSTLASFGVLRIWRHSLKAGVKPQLKQGRSIIIGAIIIHATYNAMAVIIQLMGFFG